MIRIESLTKSFSGQTVFSGLSLDIPLNKTTVITGPSGCGKTTLLRIIAGLDTDLKGALSGVPHRISFMFQEDRLLPWSSVRDNMEFVLKDIMDKASMDETINKTLKAVQLSDDADKTPSKLSGGMKRRAAMARAYCYPAELYILDEPFKGFDAKLQQDMQALFNRLFIDTHKTVLLVTHDESIISMPGINVIDLSSLSGSLA